MNDTRSLKETMLALQAENETLRCRLEDMQAELAGVDAVIEDAERYVASFEDEKRRSLERIARLEAEKSLCVDAINALRRQVKDVQADACSSEILRDALRSDLADLNGERAIILRNLQDIKEGLRKIENDADRIEPYGKQQDDMLKKAYLMLKEAQDRMELTIMLKKCEETP